jgi:large subunit ribosomal protein L35
VFSEAKQMGYKFKPAKAVAKRFKVTKTGKLKRHHAFTSHLMSARPAKRRRKLRRPAILFEGHARNMRAMMGLSHLKPAQIEHERALAEKSSEQPGGTEGAAAAGARETKTSKKAPARARAAKPQA